MKKKLLHLCYYLYLQLTDRRRITELTGERVVFNRLKRQGVLDNFAGKRILEIGPKHGQDSLLLATLKPSELVLIDLPEKTPKVERWLPRVSKLCPTIYLEGNLLYLNPEQYKQLKAFDLVWCSGVLYHNIEQIRLLKRLYDLCNLDGFVVIESATTRNKKIQNLNVVEVHWPHPYRGTPTTTHLPSRLAIKSWLEMVGFSDVKIWDIYSRAIRVQRAVLTANKTSVSKSQMSYEALGVNPEYIVGNSV